ncbi:MAG: O-acetyl-ADP-ribose deacetylase [Bacteroidetes bacterium]|nr:O-acetyl-ADP-ribose deacetylase [Bacteroidota bacterium]
MKTTDIIRLIKGDITKLSVDAIVNAANNRLMGGGGVDGAIHRAAGPELLQACSLIGYCATGDAKATEGFRLSAKYVIHTVGPVWRGGNNQEPEQLASCYQRSLEEAASLKCRTVAFPNISTGVYGFPKEQAARIALGTVTTYLENHPGQFDEIIFVCFDDTNFELYLNLLNQPDNRQMR